MPYGAAPRQRLDIYRPAASPCPAPVVVFFYGGAWDSGARGNYEFVAAPLAGRGMVVVVPDYRLYPEIRYPTFLRDNADAVAWVFAHLTEFGGDADRVFLMGHSAGAYNAAMLTLDPGYLSAAGVDRRRLAGMIGLAGPYDFKPTHESVAPVFADIGDDPSGQPISYANSPAPPMLLLAGGADETVQPRNTRVLAARAATAGTHVRSRFYPGVGHIGIILALSSLFRGSAPVLDDVSDFVRDPTGQGAAPPCPSSAMPER